MKKISKKESTILKGIGLVSLASLLFEITLTRIFSVVMYYHFAFMVISLAMFGFGMSGLITYLKPSWFKINNETIGKLLWKNSLYFSVSMFISLLAVLQAQVDLSFKQENIIKLIGIYLVAALPFFFVGICVSVAMKQFRELIGKLYFWDLLGASIGCVVAIPTIDIFGGPGAVLIASGIAAFGSYFFVKVENEDTISLPKYIPIVGAISLIFGLIILINGFINVGKFYLSKGQFSAIGIFSILLGFIGIVASSKNFKTLSFRLPMIFASLIFLLAIVNIKMEFLRVIFAKGAREENLIFSQWNSFSRISVDVDPPTGIHTLKIDSDAATHVVKTNGHIENEKPYREALSGAAYHLRENANNVLIIGPGGGWDIATALAFHAKDIAACEINPIIVNSVMKGKFKEYTGGLYEFPNVHVHVSEGRSFIRNSQQKFDIIQATLVDTWAATAGGTLSLTENNLYTVEAFEDYINHLTDDGMVTMTRWLFNPDQQALRLTALGITALENLKIEHPEKHIMLVSSGKGFEKTNQTICTFLLKKTPFTDAEVRKMETDSALYGFSIIYTPLTQPDNAFTKLIASTNRETFYNNYPYDVTPTYDNKPFFFFTLKGKDFFNAFSGDYELVKNNAGLIALIGLLMIVFILACGCIIAPLLMFKRNILKQNTPHSLRTIFYFAGIGMGFMAIEIALLQKFVFFLGHPIYSLSVVLFSILLFSSLGSYLTNRITSEGVPWILRIFLILISILMGLYLIGLPFLLYKCIGLPIFVKILLVVILLAPLALLMGMPFPLGVKAIPQQASDMISWAWGVNGATSVLGSVLAVTLAVNFGYNALLIFGIGIYAVSVFILPKKIIMEESFVESNSGLIISEEAKA